MEASPCVPLIADEGEGNARIHGSHAILVTGPLYWCRVCGKYADIRSRGLARPCGPPSKWGRQCMSFLARGLHPESKKRGIPLEAQAPVGEAPDRE